MTKGRSDAHWLVHITRIYKPRLCFNVVTDLEKTTLIFCACISPSIFWGEKYLLYKALWAFLEKSYVIRNLPIIIVLLRKNKKSEMTQAVGFRTLQLLVTAHWPLYRATKSHSQITYSLPFTLSFQVARFNRRSRGCCQPCLAHVQVVWTYRTVGHIGLNSIRVRKLGAPIPWVLNTTLLVGWQEIGTTTTPSAVHSFSSAKDVEINAEVVHIPGWNWIATELNVQLGASGAVLNHFWVRSQGQV